MNFPSYPASQQAPPHQSFLHRRYRSPDSEEVVTGPIPALRRRLYVLKDEIGKTNGIIDDCKITKVFSEDNETKLSQIQAIQTCTFRDLAILLSNHGSDWIDQTLAGGLSYAEFTDLDPQTIQAFEMRFSKFGSLLDELRWSLSYTRSDGDKVVPKQAHFFSEQKYAKSSSHDAQCNAPGNDIANVVDFEGVKAMITKLNSLLKVKVEEEKEQKEKNEEMDAECEKS